MFVQNSKKYGSCTFCRYKSISISLKCNLLDGISWYFQLKKINLCFYVSISHYVWVCYNLYASQLNFHSYVNTN